MFIVELSLRSSNDKVNPTCQLYNVFRCTLSCVDMFCRIKGLEDMINHHSSVHNLKWYYSTTQKYVNQKMRIISRGDVFITYHTTSIATALEM